HPADSALALYADEDFHTAMSHAWTAARELSKETDKANLNYNGRWRLTMPPSVREVEDRSGGGAAARGWWHALTGRCPDREVVVIAAIDRRGQLDSVGAIAAKKKSVATTKRFDTILVATDA